MKKILLLLSLLCYFTPYSQDIRGLFKVASGTPCTPTTPSSPTVNADDDLDLISASHALGNSEILVSINNGAYVQYTGVISVGNNVRPVGYYKFKIKSIPCVRTESAVVQSPAFTAVGNSTGDGYEPEVIAYLTKIGATDTTDILYEGTNQEITVQYLKDTLNFYAKFLKRQGGWYGDSAFIHIGFGENEEAIGVNFLDTGKYNMTFPNGITPTRWGIKPDGINQYGETGFNVFVNGYPTGGIGEWSEYNPLRFQGYMGIYTAGASATLKAIVNANSRFDLHSSPSYTYTDFLRETDNNGRLFHNGSLGKVGFTYANKQGSAHHTLKKNDDSLIAFSDNAVSGGIFPNTTFKAGLEADAPFSFVIFRNKGLNDTEEDSMAYMVNRMILAFKRDEVPPIQSGAPSSPVVNNELKLLQFVPNGYYTSITDYEMSLDGGETWVPLTTANARKEETPYGTPYNLMNAYVGNFDLAEGEVHIRVAEQPGVLASSSIVNGEPFTNDEDYDRWKPNITFFQSDAGSHSDYKYQTMHFDRPMGWGNLQEWFMFQYTLDSGATVHTCTSMPQYLGNINVPAGHFGIRSLDTATGTAKSGWDWYESAIVKNVENHVTLTGLKTFDNTVRASTTNGLYTITLTNNNLALQVNDYIIIGNNSHPNAVNDTLLRGYYGVGGGWPNWRATDSTALLTYGKNFPEQTYFGDIATGYVRRKTFVKDSNDNLIIVGSDTAVYYPIYLPTGAIHPDRSIIIPRPLRARVVAVGGGGTSITLDLPAQATLTNAYVWFDNSVPINTQFDTLSDHSYVHHPVGDYPIGDQIRLDGHYNTKLMARGVKWFAPPNTRTASFLMENPGSEINPDTTEPGTFTVQSNYSFHTMGFWWSYSGEIDDWNSSQYPTLDQAFNNDIYHVMPCFGFNTSYFKAYDIRAIDGITANIRSVSSIDYLIKGYRSTKTNIINTEGAGGAYYGSYYWTNLAEGSVGGVWDGKGDTTFVSPMFVNAWECFNARGTTFKNGIVINGHGSFNGSALCRMDNVSVYIKAGSRLYQNPGHPIQENNVFVKNHGWSYKNTFYKLKMYIEESIITGIPDIYPIGIIDRGGQHYAGGVKSTLGLRIIGCEYHRPDMTTESLWNGSGQAMRVVGSGGEIDSVIVTGEFKPSLVTPTNMNTFGHSSVVMSGSECGTTEGGIGYVTNVTAPTIMVASDVTVNNLTATQNFFGTSTPAIVRSGTVCAGVDTTITGTTFTFAPTIDPGSVGTVSSTEWIFKNASYPDGSPMSFSGTSTTSVTIPTSLPQSITLTVIETGSFFPVGANVYLAADDIFIEAKVTSYNSTTGELVVNALLKSGSGTGVRSSWSVSSEPVITDIYDADATISGLIPGVYVYELKACFSTGDCRSTGVARDALAITKQ